MERPDPARLRDRITRLRERLADTLPGRILARVGETQIMLLAAALSFYTLLSLAPLVLLLLWATTSLLPAAQEEFFKQVALLAGPEAESTARLIVDNASETPGAGSWAAAFGTAALLFGASVVFAQLQHALNLIFHSQRDALAGVLGFLRKRLIGVGIVFGLGFLVVVSMAAHALLQLIIDELPVGVPFYSTVFAFVLYTVVFTLVYRLLPDRPVGWRLCALGGASTALLFLLGRWGISLYLGHAAMGSAYGPAGGLVVLLVWIYYCAVVFFFGALVTAVLSEREQPRDA